MHHHHNHHLVTDLIIAGAVTRALGPTIDRAMVRAFPPKIYVVPQPKAPRPPMPLPARVVFSGIFFGLLGWLLIGPHVDEIAQFCSPALRLFGLG